MGVEETRTNNSYGFLITSKLPTLMMRVFFTRSLCPFVMELNTHLGQEMQQHLEEPRLWLLPPSSQKPGGQHQLAGASTVP